MKETGENNHLLPERKEISSNSSYMHDLDKDLKQRWGDDGPCLQQMTWIRNLALSCLQVFLLHVFCLSILCFFRQINQVESTMALYELITQLKGVSIP